MNRRDAIQRAALLVGGTLSAPTLAALMGACNTPAEKQAAIESFTPEVLDLVAEVAETIMPTTDTPGAKEAKVQQFIADIVTDCYKKEDQTRFFAGLNNLQERSEKAYSKTFQKCSAQERTELLTALQKEAVAEREASKDAKEKPPTPFWFTIKELTLVGYFTSEIGATKALSYVHVPGRFEGCVPLQQGQKGWAT